MEELIRVTSGERTDSARRRVDQRANVLQQLLPLRGRPLHVVQRLQQIHAFEREVCQQRAAWVRGLLLDLGQDLRLVLLDGRAQLRVLRHGRAQRQGHRLERFGKGLLGRSKSPTQHRILLEALVRS